MCETGEVGREVNECKAEGEQAGEDGGGGGGLGSEVTERKRKEK